ncbi:MAG: hypothetical protein WCO26_05200 [Deltaproteobacteria bacterium]
MLKQGDKFKDGKTERTYTVTAVDQDSIILELEDGSHQTMPNRNKPRTSIRTFVSDSLMMLTALPSSF